MMMKIFGAALIVSGGYLLGKIPGYQNKKRYMALKEIIEVFHGFKHDLTEYRLSINESFSKRGGIALELLKGCDVQGLQSEDRKSINSTMEQLKSSSYRESVDCINTLLNSLTRTVEDLLVRDKTTGKALPLVTGVIGLLVAVLLF